MDPDRELARLAALQHGVVDRTDARSLGLTDDAIHRRVRAGRLTQAHPGVYLLPGAPDTWHQRLFAACRAAGRAAVASHRAAASLWDLLDGDEVEVTVRRSKGPTPAGVVVHRSRDLFPAQVTRRHAIPVTNPLRTMIDLGAVASDDVVADAVERGLVRRLFSVAALEWVLTDLAKPGRRGCGGLRRVLDDRALGAAPPGSVLEARMARVLRSYGLPPAVFHHPVPEAHAELDFAYVDRGIAIEVDGFEVHATRPAMASDHDRHNRLVAAGWSVLRFTWYQVVRQPGMVARRLEEVLDGSSCG
jgi:very-short-patch-repair endonuclease